MIFRGRALLTPEGELKLHDTEALRAFASMGNAGTVAITVRRPTKRRTLDQNALYWGPVIDAVRNAGGQWEDREQVHEWLKDRFGVKSTRALSQQAFAAYISKIIAAGDLKDFGPDWEWSDEDAEEEIAA